MLTLQRVPQIRLGGTRPSALVVAFIATHEPVHGARPLTWRLRMGASTRVYARIAPRGIPRPSDVVLRVRV